MLYNDLSVHNDLFEKKFSILDEISKAIVVTNNISAISNLMLDLSINYTNAEKGSLMLLKGTEELSIFAARGITPQLIRSYSVKIGEGIAGTVAKNMVPVLVANIDNDEQFRGKKRDRYKTRSFISCPIVIKNKLLGVININDKKDKTPFTDDEFALLKTIANQAAIVFENALLMNQMKTKAAELEDINRNLIDTDAIKTEFLTRITHELRTPLNSIKGAVYYLQQSERKSTPEQREFYQIISNEVLNLSSNIENFLDFYRLEDEAKIIKKSVLNFSDLLKEILDSSKLLKNVLNRKSLALITDIKRASSDIIIDKIRFIQFFVNLIDGITQYLEKGDTIWISAYANDFIKIKMRFPRKIPEAILPNLADSNRIFHISNPAERLNLYLARKIAEAQRWDLNAENTDEGFMISVTIPQSSKQKIEMITNTTMDIFIDVISELLDVNVCSIMLSNAFTGELTINSARGLDDHIIKSTIIRSGDKIAGWVALEGKPLFIEDIEHDRRFGRKNLSQYSTNSLLSLPLKNGNKVIGVLNLNNKKSGESFTKNDLYAASALSERISNFLEMLGSGRYTNNIKNHLLSFEGFMSAARKYHKKAFPMPDLLTRVMDRLGADEDEKKTANYISMIYDLGLAVIDENLLKKEKLSSSDASVLKTHPHATVSLLNSFEFSEDVKRVILHHHERYDGKGYPNNLKENEIPFISRVLSVIDAFCAMISERPYRKAFTKEIALEEIRKGSGSKYDPRVVEAVESLLI